MGTMVLKLLESRVREIDAGKYPKDIISALAKEGFVERALEDLGEGLVLAEKVSQICAATGFMLWCQTVCAWYLQNTENQSLKNNFLKALVTGDLLGGTALSNPMKFYAGFEELKLKFKEHQGITLVNGRLPWVSNLDEGHVFGFIAGNSDIRRMYLATVGKQNVTLHRTPVFAVMEGTGTFSIQMKNSPFSEKELLAEDADIFVKKIRNGFVLLQLPIGFGILRALLRIMEKCLQENPTAEDYLIQKSDGFAEAYEDLWKKTMALVNFAKSDTRENFEQVLQIRLSLAEIVLAAANHALLLSGARGLFLQSELQRRIREAQFFAVLSPSIRHLRKELYGKALSAPLSIRC